MRRWDWAWSMGCVVAVACQRMPEERSPDDLGDSQDSHDASDEFDGGIDVDEGDDEVEDDDEPVDDRPVVQSSVPPPPISGGTLLLIDGGQTAVAADPDRDSVFITPLDRDDAVVAVALEPGDEPGRVIADNAGLVHVALRGGGAIATIDPVAGTMVARHETCANPRGLALDATQNRVRVACAGGELVSHEIGGPILERQFIEPDLRDVIVRPSGMIQVSRFRSAELLTLVDGVVVDRTSASLAARIPTTAWRTRAIGNAGWFMTHQSAPIGSVPLDSPGVYGSTDCHALVASNLTTDLGAGVVSSTQPFGFATLPVDVAVSPDGQRFAIVAAGQSDTSPTTQRVVTAYLLDAPPFDDDSACADPTPIIATGQPIAVEFADAETVVVQMREPAGVQVFSEPTMVIDFGAGSSYDTGHEIFHQDAGGGLACASCHPEGSDDGFVWTFDPGTRLRRTQSLRAGVGGSEPFHWDGDMADFDMIASEIHTTRMGGPQQSPARLAAFEHWVFGITPHNPEPADEALVERGSAIFIEAGCATCHNDGALANGMQAIVGNEPLQVPSLAGLALRPPYMHDGRAPDLEGAVHDMLESTQPELVLPDEDVDALVAYLGTL